MAAVLAVIRCASMPLLLALVIFARNPPILPLMLMRAFAILVVAPSAALWLIERAFAATAEVEARVLTLRLREKRIEIPFRSIASLGVWTLPLPGSGMWLRLRSGRRFRYGLQTADPTTWIEALAAAGADVRAAMAHPTAVYGHAKHAGRSWGRRHYLFKFIVFALVPTLPLFRVHQYIAYGGAFGQYYLQGFEPYAATFALYYATVAIYLMLYAALWRGVAEATALSAAWVVPSRAAMVRRAVEIGCRALYYGGVPVLLGLWFYPW